ncbi:lytic transglycosylase domain-containing protein [Actinopolyspora xinjiangensis]|uniref:lytic transglycosylase domain-containing protein n=1 Tax=Actinopolyspora xinjiangensis TaxID=405564 RepID=UPI000B8295E6|nr:lytic transglycosylase domain-containing protein [Actinopolyspora xinjiangensis]
MDSQPSARRRGPRRSPVGSLLLLLALLLPFVLVGGANALTSALFAPSGEGERERPTPRGLGVTGQLPERREPSVRLLRDSRALGNPSEPDTGAGDAIRVPSGPTGIPEPVLRAYRDAAGRISGTDPSCGLHWSVLAAIGRAESGHARSGRVDESGTTVTAILGPRLTGGSGFAAVPDTDSGELDGDPVWDRAVGPMQFLPATWSRYGADGDDDGAASPHNVRDAALAAGRYLCEAGGDLGRHDELARAVFAYNHSERYVRDVLGWATAYRTGAHPTPAPEIPELETAEPERSGEAAHPPAPTDVPEPSGRREPVEFPPLSPAPSEPGSSFEPIVPDTRQRPAGRPSSAGNGPGETTAPSSGVRGAKHSERGDAGREPEPNNAQRPGSSPGGGAAPNAEPGEPPRRGG